MRRSVMIAGNPWTLFITLEEEADTLGCIVRFQEINSEGDTADQWELQFAKVPEALRELEMSYGIGPGDWTELG